MTTPSDLTDPAFRDAMQNAEKLLDDGDYTGASRALAETYMALLERHPELMPGVAPASGAGTPGFAAARNARQLAWPPTGGITVVAGDDGKPKLNYSKERFGMSEAYSYYEFMMGLLWTLQHSQNE